jgi:uncharacterized membrane protein YqjE
MAEADSTAKGGGLFSSLRNLGHTLAALLHNRLELLSTDIEEQGWRLQQMLLLALAAGFCLAVAALLAVTFVVVLFWETYRLWAIGGLFLVFLAVGAGLAAVLAARARERPRMFATVLDEIAKDRDSISGRS